MKNGILLALILFLAGCTSGGKNGSPILYGEQNKAEAKETQQDKDTSDSLAAQTNSSDTTGNQENTKSTSTDEKAAVDKQAEKADDSGTSKNKEEKFKWYANDTSVTSQGYYDLTSLDDSASAVDDDLWRQLDLADEYHAMGVVANRDASWEEAQYYFEKGLGILANLDIETDTTMTPEATKYSEILENIIADYRTTLRSLGKLTEDVSASVLIERFGDISDRLGDDTLKVFRDEAPKEITYDLPIVMNERVKNSIVYFQTVAKEAFKKYLRRSKKYTPMMREILKEYGLPEDLIYLSLVESGYNPHAYSWARAMGLWQFISSTGRLYKLDRSWWIDERKDPIKSTHAAAQFLRDLYEEFGDWELAMAAYNGGPGRVRRTIKKQGTIDFWKMKLKRQTMDYVPLIMATTIIAKDPEKYGFYDIEFEPTVEWDEVQIDRCLELKVIAREVGCSLKEIQQLNPELLRRYTPPNEKKYVLKVPKGTKDKFLKAYASMPSPQETSWVKHKIRRGETVSTIAARYGVSQYAIFEANNLSRRSKIYAGKQLIVPVPLDREYQDYHNSKNRTYEANNSIYVVRSGDTMWDIARAFGTSVAGLRQVNYINQGSRIYVGQKLKIPTDAKNLKNKSSSGSYAIAPSTKSSGTPKSYKVRAGDTLWDIARKFGTTTSSIRKLNGLGRSSRIYPGQSLQIVSSGDIVIHKVRRGDTLSSIANRYRTTISRIRALNNINNPDQLRIGQKLKIKTR